MKIKIGYVLMFILIVLSGCDRKDEMKSKTDIEKLKKPEQTYLTENQIQAYVDKEINLAIDLGNENVIQEAASVIALSRTGISSILNENYADAIENINRAIAKAELIIRTDHPAKLISEVNIEVLDRVENAENARQIIQDVDSLMELGELQRAKNLMTKLTSELRITRESISISSYLQTLRNADKLLKEKQYEQALLDLNSLLSSVTAARSITPLPLIISQKMVLEMGKLLSEEHPDKESILTLLNNAEYQIRFSEMLGYGKAENEYQEIFNAMDEIKTELSGDKTSNVNNLVVSVEENLEQLQSDISVYKNVNTF